MKIAKILLVILLILVFLAGIGLLTCYLLTKDVELDVSKLESRQTNVKILDSKGNDIPIKNNIYTPISEISDDITSTFVSVEDKRFYNHGGIDTTRILSASVKNLFSWSFKEGASTITQQLIKNTHFTNEKTITRKLGEIKLALDLERKYTKDQILEMYLNVVYFGSGIYGIHDACLAYFDKLPNQINLSEACIIAGVVKNPSKNSPITNIEGAKQRQNIILNLLEKQGNINKNTIDSARNYNIIIKNGLTESNYTHSYLKNALAECSQILGISESEIVNNGYKISTFLDSNMQKIMYDKAVNNTDISEGYFTYATLNNQGVGTSTYVSNVPLLDSEINRQAGSTIKPFSAYLPAFSQRIITPLTQILDEKININGYSPNNYNGVYHGNVSISDSIINSYNIPSVKVLEKVGIDYSVDYMSKIGIDISENEKNLSLALGSNSVNPLQIASSYTALANYGNYKSASFVSNIIDVNGNIIYQAEKEGIQVIDKNDAFMMTDILLKTSKSGTGKKLNGFGYDIASKTGTVSAGIGKNSDGWCIAYTKSHTMIAWHGAKLDETLDNTHSGSNYPTLMVREMCELLHDSTYAEKFNPSDGVTLCKINLEELKKNQLLLRLPEDTNIPYESCYFYNDDLPENYSNEEISIPFTVTRKGIYNMIEFSCETNETYQIFKTDLFGKSVMVREIIANGNFISILDTASIFYPVGNYHIMKDN